MENKKWKLKQIPKNIFLYWGKNKPLSFMRYMTVVSFIYHNPDWNVYIYYPTVSTKKETWFSGEHKINKYDGIDYFPKLENLKGVELLPINSMGINGIDNNIPEVFKSDIIRLHLLNKYGGLWSDFDIFYIKPMTESYINQKQYDDVDFFCSHHFRKHSIGFLLSAKNNLLFKFFHGKIEENYDEKDYQSLGSKMFKKYLKHYKPGVREIEDFQINIMNIPFETVYPVQWFDASRLFDLDAPQYMTNTIGVHWFGGDDVAGKHECKTDYNTKSDIKLIKDMVELYEETKII